MATCEVDGCGRPTRRRSWCNAHYLQKIRGQEFKPPRIIGDDEARFDAHVVKTDKCWTWSAGLSDQGYGCFSLAGRHVYAHRYSFERANGKIAPGKSIDHICHNRACVRPDHLREVVQKQNAENLRGANRASRSGIRGVWYVASRDRFAVQVKHFGRRYSGGYHRTREDAERAAIRLRNELFTHNDADRKLEERVRD